MHRCEFCGTGCEEKCPSYPEAPTERPGPWEWIIAPDGTLLHMSEALTAATGWLPGELRGRNAFDLVPIIERQRAMLDFRSAVLSNSPTRIPMELADGRFEDVIFTVSPIIHQITGAVVAFAGTTTLAAFFNHGPAEEIRM